MIKIKLVKLVLFDLLAVNVEDIFSVTPCTTNDRASTINLFNIKLQHTKHLGNPKIQRELSVQYMHQKSSPGFTWWPPEYVQ